LVRVAQDRCVETPAGVEARVLGFAASLAHQAERPIRLPARVARSGQPAQPARTATVTIGWSRVVVWPPDHAASDPPLVAWLVHVAEVAASGGVEPVDWVLLTSVPIETVGDAWTIVAWYRARWLCEEYHVALKTGCALEQRH